MSFVPYSNSLAAVAALAALMLVQIVVADVVGIRRRHVPGTPVPPDHADALFRVTRAVANTNESVGVFILLIFVCLLGGASPSATAAAAWTYVIFRGLYAACYYGNYPTARSLSFAGSLLALLALLGIGVFTS